MTLTAALAIVAGLVLAAVVAHGAWNARRAGPRQPQTMQPVERAEPTFSAPVLPEVRDPPVLAAAGAASARQGPRIDALIDAIVPMRLESPVSGEFVLAHAPSTRRAGSKPFLIEGLDADSGDWEPVALGRRYSELQAGVQLANRSGALNEIEYSEFAQLMQGFAESAGALIELPDLLEVAARAKELDAFAGQHDAQLTVNLRASDVAWSPGYLQQVAARHGFVPGAVSGRLVLPSGEDHHPLLTLSFDARAALADEPEMAAVREATLSLDVPQTPESADPFAAWQEAARKLADDLGATLVDDQGHAVTLHAFNAIGQELKQMYRELEARDLAAGSASARRLFS
ncbi:MAG TPA: cell division protein ZipA C-terminal FtsZ-binding domain-containing protein [Burkholderiaceae bacterium]|nr:cell division protein ZipA C-terminal FtsZ-binding domain-containing protein [Burkholderiaceae bacterium]